MAPFHLSSMSRNKGKPTSCQKTTRNHPLFIWFDRLTGIPFHFFTVYLLRPWSGSQVSDSGGGWWDTASRGAQLQRQEHHGCHFHSFPAQEHRFVIHFCPQLHFINTLVFWRPWQWFWMFCPQGARKRFKTKWTSFSVNSDKSIPRDLAPRPA